MRTVLAAILCLLASHLCLGQTPCPICTPGTTPVYYRVTFAGTSDAGLNGKTFKLIQVGPNVWRSEWRVKPVTPAEIAGFDLQPGPWVPRIPGKSVVFYHGGYNPATKTFCGEPGKGLLSANVAGLIGDLAGVVATAGERDGNGPFVISLSGGGTATVAP